jgi:hypothetical protein
LSLRTATRNAPNAPGAVSVEASAALKNRGLNQQN